MVETGRRRRGIGNGLLALIVLAVILLVAFLEVEGRKRDADAAGVPPGAAVDTVGGASR